MAFGAAMPSYGQIALEFAKVNGEPDLYPLIEKDQEIAQEGNTDALYVNEQFPAGPQEIRQIDWVEHTLNELQLFKSGQPVEVIYIIPSSEEEVIVVCRRGTNVGYLRLMALSGEATKARP